jgi:hypothetical protein
MARGPLLVAPDLRRLLRHARRASAGAKDRRVTALDVELGEREIQALLFALALLVRELRGRGRAVPAELAAVDRCLRDALETGAPCRIVSQPAAHARTVDCVDISFVPIERAAAAASLSRRTLERMIRDGRIVGARKVLGRRLIPVNELSQLAQPGAWE